MPIEKELKKLGVEQKTLNKQKLVNLTRDTLNHIKIIPYNEFDPSNLSNLSNYYRLIYIENAILFDREAAEYFERAIQLIQKDPVYAAIVSEGRIYKEYENFILEILSTEVPVFGEDINSKVDEFLKELRTSIAKYTVAMPIEHLTLSDLPEVVLGNVRLAPFDTLKAEHKGLSDFIQAEDAAKIWANVVIEAKSEKGKAIQRGEHEIQRIINLRTYAVRMITAL